MFHTIPLSVFPFPSAPCRKRVVSYPIIAFCCRSFNLSVTASPLRRLRASSPRGRAIGRPDRFLLDEQSFILSGTVVPCGLDSRQLYKARFSEASARVSEARHFAPAYASSVQCRVSRLASASPFGRGVTEGDGEGCPRKPCKKEGRTTVRPSLRSALIQPWSRALPQP